MARRTKIRGCTKEENVGEATELVLEHEWEIDSVHVLVDFLGGSGFQGD